VSEPTLYRWGRAVQALGRAATADEVSEVVVAMASANQLCGYKWIAIMCRRGSR
jgi:hypothetical protein